MMDWWRSPRIEIRRCALAAKGPDAGDWQPALRLFSTSADESWVLQTRAYRSLDGGVRSKDFFIAAASLNREDMAALRDAIDAALEEYAAYRDPPPETRQCITCDSSGLEVGEDGLLLPHFRPGVESVICDEEECEQWGTHPHELYPAHAAEGIAELMLNQYDPPTPVRFRTCRRCVTENFANDPRFRWIKEPVPPVCNTCNDTHLMTLYDQLVMCTRCPVPCQACRAGPFCESTPCSCTCHSKRNQR